MFMCCVVFFYLSTPFSLCLCFLDISKPPPQAPYTGNNNIYTREDANVCHGGLTDIFLRYIDIVLHPREATCCTFHRCLQFHWWDQRLRRRWCQRWRSQTSEHIPANRRREEKDIWYDCGLNPSCYVHSLPVIVDMKEMGWNTFLKWCTFPVCTLRFPISSSLHITLPLKDDFQERYFRPEPHHMWADRSINLTEITWLPWHTQALHLLQVNSTDQRSVS